MALSKWFISQAGKLIYTGAADPSFPFRILILDDHKLFRKAFTDYCIRPFFKNVDLIEFENGDEACDFIKNEIYHNNRIDLFITDINHPGLRGQELVKSIRFYEGLSVKTLRIPIIMLTMVAEGRYSELVANKMIERYFTKVAEPEDIIDCMEGILYNNI